ncbi:dienelactone hydrolase family protein [Chenggangzhangella methanolivorans]|uniref:Dienelactone hydrolase family protein n=1 Tax=Chenggangzhangella methanolivorans TaxID=1437009 RepID=A0A9E6UGY0_9HYPH|nr:dienelactone hydrolase family protein [Chenggangzhangella methanolivorans]QZN99207.1 dienelactone hydrolase family protein [Chenggangzhangella methanolivorans]
MTDRPEASRPDRCAIALYDRFTHGEMSRREFLDRLALLAGTAAGASALLSSLSNDYARAAIVAPDDRRLAIDRVSYDAADGKISGLLARPKSGDKRPAVLVIHENRGLNPHIEDVTRRLGVSGFLAFGVDLLSPAGGTPADEDKAREMIGALDLEKATAELVAAVTFLKDHPESNGSVGAVGFCWGGGMANRLAVASPDLKASVAYYGKALPPDQAAKVRAPLLLHYAGLDERINVDVPAFEDALKANEKEFEVEFYEGVDHAFNNDANPARYERRAAALAWDRTIAFLEGRLGAAVPPTR